MDDHQRLANRVSEIMLANITALDVWGFYLFSPEFDKEKELRNKLGTLWLCSLYDSIDFEMKTIPKIKIDANSKNMLDIIHNSEELIKINKSIIKMLAQLSKNEQIFLFDTRNQWVHSYFANRHKEKISVKYVEKGLLKKEKLDFIDYVSSNLAVQHQNESLDDTLERILSKPYQFVRPYLENISYFKRNRDSLYRAIISGAYIKIPF